MEGGSSRRVTASSDPRMTDGWERGAATLKGCSAPAQCSRSDEATSDTTFRCYLRGPDGVGGLTPSGTWSEWKIAIVSRADKPSGDRGDAVMMTASRDYWPDRIRARMSAAAR